jgi:hypothetical protein
MNSSPPGQKTFLKLAKKVAKHAKKRLKTAKKELKVILNETGWIGKKVKQKAAVVMNRRHTSSLDSARKARKHPSASLHSMPPALIPRAKRTKAKNPQKAVARKLPGGTGNKSFPLQTNQTEASASIQPTKTLEAATAAAASPSSPGFNTSASSALKV